MSKKRVIYNYIMIAILSITITFILTSVFMYNYLKTEAVGTIIPSKTIVETSELDRTLAALKGIIDRKFLGEADEQELYNGAIKGFINGLNDKYSEYYTPEEIEKINETLNGNYVGIGAYLTQDVDSDSIKVVKPIDGSPAKEVGLQAGDIISKIDGVEYKGSQIDEAIAVLKGKEGNEGTNVKVEIIRNGEKLEFDITRSSIKIIQVVGNVIDNEIGYIYITSFDGGCADQFKERYEELKNKNIKSLVIDLRDNGGGIVDEALEILDYLLDKDLTTLITVDKSEKEVVSKTKNDKLVDIPVVVLVNKNTASASEIMAGALKDHGRAKIIGEQTYGKGVIQELMYLSNKSALKITTNEYYTPNRNKINEIGIKPDIEVKLEISQDNITDTQLKEAVKYLKEN